LQSDFVQNKGIFKVTF